MNKNISRILKLFLFLILIVLIDQVAGIFLQKLFFTQNAGQNSALTYVFRDCNADILIFGNSRARHHYDSRLLADSLEMSCYNAGQDGGHSILMQYALIKVVTERYSPKIIILEFNPDNVTYTAGNYDRLSVLLPYYKEYTELRHIIYLRSPFEKIKLLSAIYPFNSNIVNIIRFNTNTYAARKKDIEGFVPIKSQELNVELTTKGFELKNDLEIESQSVVDSNLVNALKNIISLCKDKNILLFIVSSPIFHGINEKQNPPSLSANTALEIIHKNNVNYIDLSFDSTITGHTEWFYDRGHLNDIGATIFTNKLAGILKNCK